MNNAISILNYYGISIHSRCPALAGNWLQLLVYATHEKQKTDNIEEEEEEEVEMILLIHIIINLMHGIVCSIKWIFFSTNNRIRWNGKDFSHAQRQPDSISSLGWIITEQNQKTKKTSLDFLFTTHNYTQWSEKYARSPHYDIICFFS